MPMRLFQCVQEVRQKELKETRAQASVKEYLQNLHASLQAIDADIQKAIVSLQKTIKEKQAKGVEPDAVMLAELRVRRHQQQYLRNEIAKIELQLPVHMIAAPVVEKPRWKR